MNSYTQNPTVQGIKDYLSYGSIVIVAVILFALLADSNKWFANFVYVFCLLPSLFLIRKNYVAFKNTWSVLGMLFLYAFYSACVLFFYKSGADHLKFFLFLLLFYIFVFINFNTDKRIFGLFFSILIVSVVFLTYGAFDAENLGVQRYGFGNINENRLTILFALPFAWLGWHCSLKDNTYKYAAWLLFFMYVTFNFYLLGSRSILFLVGTYLAFFIYEFRRELKIKEIVFIFSLIFILSCFFVFYDPLYEKLIARGSSYRMEIWIDVVNRMADKQCFLFGCGKTDTYKFLGIFDNPHGVFISSFYYYGSVGFLLLLTFLTVCFLKLEGFYRAWFVACLAFFVFTHVELIRKPSVIWIYFWLPLFMGLINKKKAEDV